MKKKNFWIKLILAGSALGIMNRMFFKLASYKYKRIQKKYKTYSWKLGNIHYRVEGKGQPILLIHGIGNGASSYEWRKNIPLLSKNFRVYSVDLLGFGYSSRPKITYTAYLYVQLIQDFIKNVIKEPAFVIANSQSASFAVMSCAMSPGLFKKLILISPTGIEKQSTYPDQKTKMLKRIIETPIIGTAFYQILASKPYTYYFLKNKLYKSGHSINASLINAYYGSAHLGGPSSRYLLASFLGEYLNVNVREALNKITCPICIVWGRENELVPVTLSDEWSLVKPSITSYVFNKSKAMPHEEEPLYFNEVCKNFLMK